MVICGHVETFVLWRVQTDASAIKSSLSDAELAQLKKSFDFYDIDGDGVVTREEMRIALQKLGKDGVTDSEIEANYANLDVNKDQKVTFDDFLIAYGLNSGASGQVCLRAESINRQAF